MVKFEAVETFSQKIERERLEALVARKAELKVLIEAERDRRMNEVGYTYKKKQIRADKDSKDNLMGYLFQKDKIEYPLYWRCMDNSRLKLAKAADVDALSIAMTNFVQTTFHDSWAVKDKIYASTDLAEVEQFFSEYMGQEVAA